MLADLERELASLNREEQKLVQQIKQSAKQGNQVATRTLAKSLVRLRAQQSKLIASVAHMKGVSTTLTVSNHFLWNRIHQLQHANRSSAVRQARAGRLVCQGRLTLLYGTLLFPFANDPPYLTFHKIAQILCGSDVSVWKEP